jgi:hypothetical protein
MSLIKYYAIIAFFFLIVIFVIEAFSFSIKNLHQLYESISILRFIYSILFFITEFELEINIILMGQPLEAVILRVMIYFSFTIF